METQKQEKSISDQVMDVFSNLSRAAIEHKMIVNHKLRGYAGHADPELGQVCVVHSLLLNAAAGAVDVCPALCAVVREINSLPWDEKRLWETCAPESRWGGPNVESMESHVYNWKLWRAVPNALRAIRAECLETINALEACADDLDDSAGDQAILAAAIMAARQQCALMSQRIIDAY